jgi:hypothetical protein
MNYDRQRGLDLVSHYMEITTPTTGKRGQEV